MVDEYARKLELMTGYRWRYLSPIELDHHQTILSPQPLCVVTPDELNAIRFGLWPKRYYVPLEIPLKKSPNEFVERYLNVKQQLVTELPGIKIDLKKQFLSKIVISSPEMLIEVSVFITAALILRNKNSKNNFLIAKDSFKSFDFSTKAHIALNTLLTNIKIGFDGLTGLKLPASISLANDHWETDLSIIPGNPGQVSGQLSPQPVSYSINNWDFVGMLSLDFEGTTTNKPASSKTSLLSTLAPNNFSEADYTTIEICAVVLLFIFLLPETPLLVGAAAISTAI